MLAAIRRYRGALLADPVGSGKTYVALAVAAALNRRSPIACLVPATLVSQWCSVAVQVGIDVEVGSHEQASRGRLPAVSHGPVIIDESHHFRNPCTRRYEFTAPWLAGRQVLLISATPVVNRLADLVHQLLLGIRDDALTADGLVSLQKGIMRGQALSALARIVIEEPAAGGHRPSRSAAVSPASEQECVLAGAAMERIGRLRLSRHAPTASLVRGVLLRAACSSAAALGGALRRYRTLLLHARDAHESGRSLKRAEIRRFAGEIQEQLVLWALVHDGHSEGEGGGGLELDLADIETLDPIIAETAACVAGPDPKLDRLDAILADRRPTLVFVTRRETVRHLRNRLRAGPLAWCTGQRAGIGSGTLPRQVVLGWFRTTASRLLPSVPLPPLHLIATDVAAEGLDLQRAARVVHYDAPWTPMRLEQREGRAIRLGSEHERVEVVRFLSPPALEALVRIEGTLTAKSRLPALAGLGPGAHTQWRWRVDAARELGPGTAVSGVGIVRGNQKGILAGFTLHTHAGGQAGRLAAAAGWMDTNGEWCEDAEVVARMLSAAARSEELIVPEECRIREALRALADPIRRHLSMAGGRRWATAEPEPSARCLTLRLHEAIRRAARRRDITALQRLERALAFVGGGHTAGETAVVAAARRVTGPRRSGMGGAPSISLAAAGGDRSAA